MEEKKIDEMEPGKIIKHYREKRGLSYSELAGKLGCSEQMLRYMEKGQRSLNNWIADFVHILKIPRNDIPKILKRG